MISAKCSNCKKIVENRKVRKHGIFCSKKCWYKWKSINRPYIARSSHGLSKTKFYYTWVNIENRCKRKNTEKYQSYGKRGIKLLWKSVDEFHRDMYDSYLIHVEKFGNKNTQIERIDVNGNYCKKNCRWATISEQAINRTNNRKINYNGVSLSVAEWSRKLKVPYSRLWSRIDRGWSFNELIEKSKWKRKQK